MAHMHYKGTGKVHSFKGLLIDGVATGEQRKIRIGGATGDRAWRIIRFHIIAKNPGTSGYEHVMKIYREEQTSVDGEIDFENDELLAAAFLQGHSDSNSTEAEIVVFDNALFVRNIYVTQADMDGNLACNYYIELEEVKVSKAGMAQLAVAAARRTIVD